MASMTNNNNNISVHIPCQITGTHINFIPDTKKLHTKKKHPNNTESPQHKNLKNTTKKGGKEEEHGT